MAGARIAHVLLRRANLRYPFQPDFARRLEGQAVRGVSRRAKYLLVELESGDALLMHLGMSGSFRSIGMTSAPALRKGAPSTGRAAPVVREGAPDESATYYHEVERLETHDHVVIEMSNGTAVVFNDPRRFGFMTVLTPDEIGTHAALVKLGPEPLVRAFDAAALAAALGGRKTSLKIALSDQRIVSGLGNIYVSEALHRARLSPKRKASTLVLKSGEPRQGLHDLVEAIRAVLTQAIKRQYRAE